MNGESWEKSSGDDTSLQYTSFAIESGVRWEMMCIPRSCIMPTAGRRRWLPQPSVFLRQDYPNRELVILDDGDVTVEDLIPIIDWLRRIIVVTRQIRDTAATCRMRSRRPGAMILHWTTLVRISQCICGDEVLPVTSPSSR